MNIDQMRVVDLVIGGFLTTAIGWFRRFLGKRSRLSVLEPDGPETIVLIKFLGMGSVINAAPTVRALRRQFPVARIILLTSPEIESFARMIPDFDEIRVLHLASPLGLARDLIKHVLGLRLKRPGLVLDLEFFSNFTSFLTACLGARCSIGFATPKTSRNWVYDEVVAFDHGRHIREIFFKMAQVIDLEVAMPFSHHMLKDLSLAGELILDPPDFAGSVLDRVAAGGWDRVRPLVIVNVNAGPLNYNRRWPLDRYRALIDHVLASGSVHVVLIGSPGEVGYVAQLGLPPQPFLTNLAGQLSMSDLLRLMFEISLYVGNDSGPLHMAQSCGARTLSFFGPETPALYGPPGPGHTVFYESLPCSPCLNVYNHKSSDCQDNQCLKRIHLERVIPAIDKLIDRLAGAQRQAEVKEIAT